MPNDKLRIQGAARKRCGTALVPESDSAPPYAVSRLATRFGLTLAMASLVAELAGLVRQ